MDERCPRCRELLLTLNWTALKQCEPCDGYLEPDGRWVERREGDLRYAEAVTRGRPHTVAELAAALRSPPESLAEDLRELCERHRRIHRDFFEPPPRWLVFESSEADLPGYRDQVSRQRTVIRTRHAMPSLPPWSRWVFAGSGTGVASGFVLGQFFPTVGAVVFAAGFVSGFIGLNVSLHGRSERQPIVAFTRWQDSRVLVDHSAKEHVQLSLDQASVETEDTLAYQRTTYRAWLVAPGYRRLIGQSALRSELRNRVIHLEHALTLDAPPPR